jgi:hypothetical protein
LLNSSIFEIFSSLKESSYFFKKEIEFNKNIKNIKIENVYIKKFIFLNLNILIKLKKPKAKTIEIIGVYTFRCLVGPRVTSPKKVNTK